MYLKGQTPAQLLLTIIKDYNASSHSFVTFNDVNSLHDVTSIPDR